MFCVLCNIYITFSPGRLKQCKYFKSSSSETLTNTSSNKSNRVSSRAKRTRTESDLGNIPCSSEDEVSQLISPSGVQCTSTTDATERLEIIENSISLPEISTSGNEEILAPLIMDVVDDKLLNIAFSHQTSPILVKDSKCQEEEDDKNSGNEDIAIRGNYI